MIPKVDFMKTIALKTLITLSVLFLVLSFVACSDGNQRGSGSGGHSLICTWELTGNPSGNWFKFYADKTAECYPEPTTTGTDDKTLIYSGNPLESGTVTLKARALVNAARGNEAAVPPQFTFTVTTSNGTVTATMQGAGARYNVRTNGSSSSSGGSSSSGSSSG